MTKDTRTHKAFGHQSQILKWPFSIETSNFGWLRNRDKMYKTAEQKKISFIYSALLTQKNLRENSIQC